SRTCSTGSMGMICSAITALSSWIFTSTGALMAGSWEYPRNATASPTRPVRAARNKNVALERVGAAMVFSEVLGGKTYWNPRRRSCPEKSNLPAKNPFPPRQIPFNISVHLHLHYGTDNKETTTWPQIHP